MKPGWFGFELETTDQPCLTVFESGQSDGEDILRWHPIDPYTGKFEAVGRKDAEALQKNSYETLKKLRKLNG